MNFSSRLLMHAFASPRITFYVLPWLMVILVVGTISQRYIGLYEAEKLFFSSWWIWLGPVPVPGTYPTLALLTLGLLAKLIFKTSWKKAQSGIIITHLGALLLLVGGLITAVSAEEGYLILAEDTSGNIVSDYHAREFVVLKNDAVVVSLSAYELADNMQIAADVLPFALRVKTYCRNCMPEDQDAPLAEHRGMAGKVKLTKAPLQKEDEENLSGVVFEVAGVDAQQNGIYSVFEPMPHQPEITVGGDVYRMDIRKEQRILPFKVALNAFEKFSYPGTQMASEYQSDVTVTEANGISWTQSIRMNEPLRTHGYTLYQSSFIQAQGETMSVLAVVKNHGFIFPYLASLVMAIGLGIHMRVRSRKVVG